MKDQVTTIEQSRRLEELGVSEEKASMLWFGENDDELAPREAANTLTMHYQGEYLKDTIHYPAFTVADLMEMMPSRLVRYEVSYFMTITREHGRWSLHWCHSQFDCIGYFKKTSLIDLLCDRIEWLVSNGYKLNT